MAALLGGADCRVFEGNARKQFLFRLTLRSRIFLEIVGVLSIEGLIQVSSKRHQWGL